MSDSTPQEVSPQEIPYGNCHCGCGGKTTISKYRDQSKGWIAGEPRLYLRGHNRTPQPYAAKVNFNQTYDVDSITGCWIWKRRWSKGGYGVMQANNRPYVLAHRYAWEKIHGEVPPGMELHHKCGLRRRVNPDHLELLNHAQHCQEDRSKLSWEDVKEIRLAYSQGGISQRGLAKEFHISQAQIWEIVNNKSWVK
jgi:hypothetical protein